VPVVGRIQRLGTAPLKGARRHCPEELEITVRGAQHDRRWCLVEHVEDPARARVLRTIENPAVLTLTATVDADGEPVVTLPSGDELRPTGPPGAETTADYWGRRARVRPLPGEWQALAQLTGRDVTVCRSAPGDVVWDAPVTVVTSASLAELARRAGRAAVDPERFRSTLCLDVDAPPFAEDGWVGRRLRLGDVELAVTRPVARCAVVRLRPGTGEREDDDPMRLLAPDRTVAGEVVFGVGARVVVPGRLRVGDAVRT
jgi:uncharacterized protein YcbX